MIKSLPPLGRVMNWLEASGFPVSYTFEDLVFVESNAFLIRFDHSDPLKILWHINIDCEKAKVVELERILTKEAGKHGISPVKGGNFALLQKNAEEIELHFEN